MLPQFLNTEYTEQEQQHRKVSMFCTSASLSSSAQFAGAKVIVTNGRPSSPKSIKFQTPRISAACASTAERTRSCTESSSSSSSSLYEVLGVQMGASSQEIKAAYRRLARVVHPDVVTKGQRGQTSGCEFMKIHEAYATLSDPESRANYDRVLYRSRRRGGSPLATSTYAVAMASRFASNTRRTWETDQCW